MTDSITVELRGLSGTVSLQVPEGSTVADVREAADLNDGLSIRSDGQTISDEAATTVRDEQILVSTAPGAKHGA
jgi:hypothetical protein